MVGESGHDASYARSMTDALRVRGVVGDVLVPILAQVSDRRPNWHFLLPSKGSQPVLGRFRYWIALQSAVSRFLRSIRAEAPGANVRIFLESFTLLQLSAVIPCLFFRGRGTCTLSLLFRTDHELRGTRLRAYKALLFAVQIISGKAVMLLTDSDSLKRHFDALLQSNFVTLPIPHAMLTQSPAATFPAFQERSGRRDPVLWWPGSPRPEKGLAIIRRICSSWQSEQSVTFLASEKAALVSPNSQLTIVALPDPLSQAEYIEAMAEASIILLPYDSKIYRYATSGVFVETVTSARIPFVTANTWMAAELKRFHLPELIVDWDDPSILARLFVTAEDNKVLEKLGAMRQYYSNFHAHENFAEVISDAFRAQG